MSWAAYVKSVIGDDRQTDVAHKTDIDQTTISRWLHDEHRSITPTTVTRFAHGYSVPVLEAFVEAGLLTADDIKVRVVTRRTLRDVDTSTLLDELARRTSSERVS
jgi:transcriptional regulator with XRE-family HTH domain